MSRTVRWEAASGAVAVALFFAGSLVVPERAAFDAAPAETAAWFEQGSARIQAGSALLVLSAPFFVWFLATVASIARPGGDAARRAAAGAFGCGLVFIALFLADVTALAVGALRPENMVREPELAAALQDFEFLAMGSAAFAVCGMLAAFALLTLREGAVWPRWIGWLAALAAAAYALRAGTLFSADGAFAADGLLGLWVPVAAATAWLLTASLRLALGRTR